MAAAESAFGSAISAEAKEQAQDAKAKAVARIAELEMQWATAQAELHPKLDAVAPAREAANAAEAARVAAAEAARQAARELEPVSVFISRKTQRLYVRRAFQPILESPVTILVACLAGVILLGDLWVLGHHKLLCGDARSAADVARVMADCHADLAFLDPPYNVCIGTVVGRSRTKHSEFAMASGEMSVRSGCQAFAPLLHPPSGFPPVAPVSARRSRSAIAPE